MRMYDCELYLKDGARYSEKFIEVAALNGCYIEIGGTDIVLDQEESILNSDGMMLGMGVIVVLFSAVIATLLYKIFKIRW